MKSRRGEPDSETDKGKERKAKEKVCGGQSNDFKRKSCVEETGGREARSGTKEVDSKCCTTV